jgi:hypothetical protein
VSAVLAERYGLLWAIGSILVLLALGMIILLFVKRITVKDPIRY